MISKDEARQMQPVMRLFGMDALKAAATAVFAEPEDEPDPDEDWHNALDCFTDTVDLIEGLKESIPGTQSLELQNIFNAYLSSVQAHAADLQQWLRANGVF